MGEKDTSERGERWLSQKLGNGGYVVSGQDGSGPVAANESWEVKTVRSLGNIKYNVE